MSAVYNSTVQGFYLSYYGRPADPAGLTFWTGQLAAAGGNLDAILNAFGTSAEATRRYGTGTNASKIEAIYQQTFGRAADATGLAFYEGELAAGRMTLINASKRIIDGAGGDDIPTRANRLSAAQSFTDKLDTDAERAGYSGVGAEDAARAWVRTVTKDAATLTAAVASADATITGLLPQTFSLTVNADTFTGSAGNDTVSAVLSLATTGSGAGTLQGTDKIDGGAGEDKLSVTVGTNFDGFTTGSLKNVETLELNISSAAATTFNAKGSSGVTTVAISNTQDADVTVSELNTGLKTISITGGQKADTYTTSLEVTAAERLSTSTADAIAVTLNANGVSATSRSTIDLGSFETLNATLVGANHLTLGNEVRNFNVVSGSGATTLNGGTAIRTVDASAATGAVAINVTAVTAAQQITSIKGGSGGGTITADIQDLSPVVALSAGAGSDTAVLNSTAIATFAPVMSGVEVVRFNNISGGAVTFSGASATGLTTVETQAATTGNVGTTQNVTVAGLGSSALIVNARGATPDSTFTTSNSGATTLNYKGTGTAAAAGTGVDSPLGDYTFSNSSALTVNVEAFVDVSNGSTITASAAKSVALNVASGKVGGAEVTEYTGGITAPEATSITVNASGKLDTAAITAVKATSLTVTNGETAGTLSFTGATATADKKLSSMSITSGSNLTLTLPQSLEVLETLTVSTSNGGVVAFPAASAFAKVSSVSLSGSGTNASITGLGALGATANNTDLSLTATGLTAGLSTGALQVAAGKAVTVNLTGTTGNVSIGNINAADAGSVTITAPGIGTKAIATNGLEVGSITANATSGTVSIDASGVRAPQIGTVQGNKVTVNFANATEGTVGGKTNPTVGAITVGSELNLTLYSLGGTSQSITASGTTGSLATTITGGIGNDAITVSLGGKPTLTMSGNLGDSSSGDTIVISTTPITGARSIDLSGVTSIGALRTEIRGSNGGTGETIKGTGGSDTIVPGSGKAVLTGGAGSDLFMFNHGVSTLAAAGSAANLSEITDFQAIDRIAPGFSSLATPNVPANVTTPTAVNATGQLSGASADITISNGGFTFSGTTASTLSLEQKVAIIDQHINDATGTIAFFLHSGTAYAYIDNGTGGGGAGYNHSVVIKLTGISSLPGTAFGTADSTDATAADPTPTGLFGYGG